MIRTIVIPKSRTISFDVPQKFIGKEIQVIAFEKEEVAENQQLLKKIVSFETISIDTKKFKFNRDDANER
jgi:hypothetical protein